MTKNYNRCFSFIFACIASTGLLAQLANWTPVPSGTNFPTNLVGQINGMTRISQMKFHASNPSKFYAITSQGGLFLTNNAAASWTVAPGTETLNMNCAAVCVDYTNDQNIWLGTGDPNYYSNGQGIYYSSNGGQSFAATSLVNCLVIEIIQNPANSLEYLAATNKGIYKSSNGGVSWAATTATTLAFCDMKSSAAVNSQTIFACTNEVSSKFLRSTDFGSTWTQITSGIATPTAQTQAGARIGVTPSNTNVVYFELISDGGMVHKSNDLGLNFILKKPGGSPYLTFYSNTVTAGGQGNYNNSIAVDAINPAKVWLQAHNTWFSADSGATWSMLTFWASTVHTDMHQVGQSPYDATKLYSCNDGGVWLSSDGGNSWTPKSNGIYAFEIGNETGVSSPVQSDFVSIGTQDNARLYGNANGWFTISGGDDYAKRQFDYNGNIYIDGTNRQLNHTGANAAYNLPTANWNYFAFNHTNNNLAFMGYTEVYRSMDIASASPTWTQISNFSQTITAMHSCIANPNRLYVLVNTGGFYICTNALSQNPVFTAITMPGGNANIGSIVAMANNANIVYVHKNNAIYRSQDGGLTWATVTYNLPNVNHRRILAEEYGGSQELVMVATNNAVYYKQAGQTSWTNYSTGLPTRKSPTGFSMYDNGTSQSRIRYATYGRGMWESGFANLRAFAADIIFNSDTTITCSNPSVQVTDGSVGVNNGPLTYTWNFPGGSPSVAYTQSVGVTYTSTGTYTMSLTIKDALNTVSTKTLSRFIQVISCSTDTIPGNDMQALGGGNYASTNASLAIGTTNSITLSAWIKINSTQPSFAGIIFTGSGGATGLDFRSNNQLGYHYNNAAATYNFAGGPTVPMNTWVHVALVTTSSYATLYMNGVPYVNNSPNAPINFNGSFNIGNDRDNTSRTMTGLIDEVCIYNRALSQNEIREQMHLTKNHNVIDAGLVAYYQFNEIGGTVYNRAGSVHATLKGTAVHQLSSAPVGSGNSERQSIVTNGVKTFTAEGTTLTFPGPLLPNVELCVTRLNIPPDSVPPNNTFNNASKRYWIINNYGNQVFTTLTNYSLSGFGTITPAEASAPNKFRLYSRATGGFLNSSWQLIDSAYAAASGTNGALTFSGNVISSFNKQFTIVKNACLSSTISSASVNVNPTCANAPVVLSAGTGTLNDAAAWKWYTGSCGGILAGSGTTISVSPSVTTTYYVRGEGGCVGTGSGVCTAITVSIKPTPATPSAITGPSVVCAGSKSLFGVFPVSGAISYSWSLPAGWSVTTSANSATLQAGSTSGTLLAMAINSCGASAPASMAVAVNPTVASVQNVSICSGSSYFIGNHSYSVSGTYTDALTSSNGCDSIVTSHIFVDAAVDTSLYVSGATLSSNAGNATYQWFNCDSMLVVQGATSQSFTPTANGHYALIVTINGCTDTSACYNIREVGINKYSNDNLFRIYPNPGSDWVAVQTTMENTNLSITNAIGQQVWYGRANGRSYRIRVATLPTGIYFVRLSSGSQSAVGKLVVER